MCKPSVGETAEAELPEREIAGTGWQREENKQAKLRSAAARQTYNRQADRREDPFRRADHARQAAQAA